MPAAVRKASAGEDRIKPLSGVVVAMAKRAASKPPSSPGESATTAVSLTTGSIAYIPLTSSKSGQIGGKIVVTVESGMTGFIAALLRKRGA